MKRTFAAGAAVLVAVVTGGLVASAPAAAETQVSVTIGTQAVGAEIDSTNGVLYHDPSKGDTPDTAYQIAYRGTLDMRNVWSNYASARSFYILSQILKGISYPDAVTKWERFQLVGGFEIGFTVDTARVSVDPSFVTCAGVQARYEAENPDTTFTQLMTCQSVTYNASTGAYVAKFETKHKDGTNATTKELDAADAKPASLMISTPERALYVPQSKFESGRSFDMVNAYVRGSLTLDLLFISQLPVVFTSNVPAPVTLRMADTYAAAYAFAPAAGAPALPAEVTGLLPPTRTGLRPETVVEPVQPAQTVVETPRGTWTFAGWDPATQTVKDADVRFLGTWTFQKAATYAASFRFDPADGAARLPDAVTALLPASIADLLPGDEVQAPLPASTRVSVGGGVWEFQGWVPERQTITDGDVQFVGTWKFVKSPVTPITPTPPTTHPKPVPSELSATGAGDSWALGAAAMLTMLLGGGAILASRRRLQR